MTYSKRFAVIMLVVAMILSMSGIAGATAPDVEGTRYEEAVDYLMGLGVVAGYPDGTYKPEATLTRAEAAKILTIIKYGDSTMANLLKGSSPFSDVPGTHWASGYIALAKNAGIVNGYPDGTYKPGNPVTYAELATMLCKAAGLAPVAGLEWPANYMAAALAAGMLTGVPGAEANAPVTRGDCAIMTAFTVKEIKNPATGKTLAQSVFGESMVASIALVPATSTTGIGGAVQFVATAKDADGAVLTDVTIEYTTNDPAKAAVNSTGLFVASASGTYTVTATAGEATGTATVAVYGAPAALKATPATATVPANGETEIEVKVEVVDANGIVVADDDETEITFEYDDDGDNGAVTLHEDEDAVKEASNGSVTFTFVAGEDADVTDILLFYEDVEDSDIDEATAEITAIEQIATAIELEADPEELMANEIAYGEVTATVLDQAGEMMLTGTYELTFSVSGKGTIDGDTDDVTEATILSEATIPVESIKGDPGTFTITATGEGLTAGSVTVDTYIAGSPVAIKIEVIDGAVNADDADAEDDALEVEFTLIDKWGHATINPGDGEGSGDVDLTLAYDEDAEFWSLDMYNADEGEIYITIPEDQSSYKTKFYGTVAGTWTVTVTDDDEDLTGGSFDVVVTAGEAAAVTLTPGLDDYELYLLISNPKADFTAQVEDAFGNKVAQAGLALEFYAEGEATGDYDVTDDGEVKTNSDGKATVTFTFDPYVGDAWWVSVDLYDAEDEWLGGDATEAPVVITDTMPGSLAIATYNWDGAVISTVKADATETQWSETDNHVYVIVSVDDTNGNALESTNTLIEITFSNDGDNVQDVYCPWGWTELSDPEDMVFVGHTNPDGELYFRFDGAEAGSFTITAKAVQTSGPVTATKTFRTKVGTEPVSAAVFNADGTKATKVDLTKNTPVALKVSLVDNGGNVIVAPDDTTVGLEFEDMEGVQEWRLTASGTSVTSVEIGAGKTYATVYFVYSLTVDDVDLSDNAIWD